MKKLMICAVTMASVAFGCSETRDTPAPEPAPEGLSITAQDDGYIAGTYGAAGVGIAFESVVIDGETTLRLTAPNGDELIRAAIDRQGSGSAMWHYGVPVDDRSIDQQPDAMRWVESEEAQLAASLWRELTNEGIHEVPGAAGLYQYSLHIDEAMGQFAVGGATDEREHRCNDCFGQCGPGCLSFGNTEYCAKHDCCCDHYGWGYCLTTCWFSLNCPDWGGPCR